MRILIVEDEQKTAAFLRQGLEEAGFVVDTAGDGASGLQMARRTEFDLIVLDVNLPKQSGWEVIQSLRQEGIETAVLFLTARDSVSDRVKGLDLGADDYLVKPFSFSEVLARVRSILRRGSARSPNVLRIADLEIDFAAHKATRAAQRLDLTAKEFSLLSLLARRQGEVLTRTLIAEQVWDMNFSADTNVVDVHIRRLRLKVDEPFEQKLIHTIRGAGYVLEARK